MYTHFLILSSMLNINIFKQWFTNLTDKRWFTKRGQRRPVLRVCLYPSSYRNCSRTPVSQELHVPQLLPGPTRLPLRTECLCVLAPEWGTARSPRSGLMG